MVHVKRKKKFGHLPCLSSLPPHERTFKKGSRVVVTHPNPEINHKTGVLGDWGGERNKFRYWVILDSTYVTKIGLPSNKALVSTGCVWFIE